MKKRKIRLKLMMIAAAGIGLSLLLLLAGLFLSGYIAFGKKNKAETAVSVTNGTNAASEEPAASPTPEVTLPIILSNAPTPSPTASPSPTPSPTPEPSPTPVPDIAYGTVNRQSNLREIPGKKGTVKKQVQKNRQVTIHTASKDDEGDVWYFLTDDDSGTSGWMRDYLVDITSGTVSVTAAGESEQTQAVSQYIGTGVVNQKSNVRKIMNGSVISTVRKGTSVGILEAKRDKKGYLWYHIHPSDGSKDGYIKSGLVDLDAPLENDPEEDSASDGQSSEQSGVLGRAVTAQQANIRVTPTQKGKVVRQLSEGIELQILGMVENDSAQWYLVQTPSGRTKGYARAYTLKIIEIKENVEPVPYTP